VRLTLGLIESDRRLEEAGRSLHRTSFEGHLSRAVRQRRLNERLIGQACALLEVALCLGGRGE